jgi:hypothetical protein
MSLRQRAYARLLFLTNSTATLHECMSPAGVPPHCVLSRAVVALANHTCITAGSTGSTPCWPTKPRWGRGGGGPGLTGLDCNGTASRLAGWLAGGLAFELVPGFPERGGGGGGAGGGRALGAGTCGWVTVGGSLLGTENASTSWQDIARQNQSETANTNHPGCAVHRDWHWPAPPQLAAEMMLICMGQPRFLFRPDLHVGWCLCVCVQCLSMVWPAEACSSTCARSASPHLRGMRGLCSQ